MARYWRDVGHQLAGKAVLDGVIRLDLHSASVCALASSRAARQLYRWPDSARGRALHGNGVCLEPTMQRRSVLHAVSGRIERLDHDCGLCAACGIAPGIVGYHGPLGYADHVGGLI